MNRYQKILLIVACVNVAVVMLFPPFDSVPLVRGMDRSFDGFCSRVDHEGDSCFVEWSNFVQFLSQLNPFDVIKIG